MTSFGFDYDDLQVGSIADTSLRVVDSFIASEDLNFGVAVMRDPTDSTTKETRVKAWALNGVFGGVTVFSKIFANDYVTGISSIKAGDSINTIRFGRVKVLANVLVSAGDKAYIDKTSGVFTNVATDNILVGEFMKSVAAGQITTLWLK